MRKNKVNNERDTQRPTHRKPGLSPARRTRNPSLIRVFGPVIIFGAGILWVAADKGLHSWAVAAMALGLGLLLASLAPRRKVLLGSLPALGIFLVFLILGVRGGQAGLWAVTDFWAPVGLGGIVGALVGSRIRLRL